jgi:hypothetical protein
VIANPETISKRRTPAVTRESVPNQPDCELKPEFLTDGIRTPPLEGVNVRTPGIGRNNGFPLPAFFDFGKSFSTYEQFRRVAMTKVTDSMLPSPTVAHDPALGW